MDADVLPVDDFSLECASAIITTLISFFIDGKSYTTQTGKGLAKLLNISEADGDLLFNAASWLASAKGRINLTNKLASSANKLIQKEIEQIKNGLAASQAKNESLGGQGTNSAQGLVDKDFENYLNQTLGGKGSFTYKGREFDGAYGPNNSIWYEAKSGRYWQDHAQAGSKGFEKFKSDVVSNASIAKQNGASFEVHSNTPIPQHVKDWLTSKNIPFKEY
ncbi:hypothetical protein J3U22_06290 [Gilliamella sp. B2865]|uniref:hypothetical protein n=1 Tax=Gilliamella sp. B2785 TaxID=2817982 RepID=UPI002269B181|nr:hypothetical protein [Gilliamella sp. B2785]MCX8670873.1 hypothetical protein [Gilliamella sp. B2785]MCX8679212.1 hypothetical protein [Gilliamella sp. B2865]